MWPFKNYDIGIDLGTSKFSICTRGEGKVSTEAAYLAYRGEEPNERNIVDFGDAAERMLGRCPPGIQVMSPMRSGVITNSKAASTLLRLMAKRSGLLRSLSKKRALVATLLGASKIEHKAFLDVARSLDTSSVKHLIEPLAAAIGSGITIDEPNAQMLVDIGSGATEIIVLALGGMIQGHSLRVGGDSMDEALISYLAKQHCLKIGPLEAKKTKEWLSVAREPTSQIQIKGMEIASRSPNSVLLSYKELSAPLETQLQKIVNVVTATLERLPPEVSVDLIENGIHLSGGCSLFNQIPDRIRKASGLAVKVVEHPADAVVHGCELVIQNYDLVC